MFSSVLMRKPVHQSEHNIPTTHESAAPPFTAEGRLTCTLKRLCLLVCQPAPLLALTCYLLFTVLLFGCGIAHSVCCSRLLVCA